MHAEKTREELQEEIRVLRARLADSLPDGGTLSTLHPTEELNRRIMEAVPGGIVHVAADGAIIAANAEALRILGLGYDAITQRFTADFETETIWEDGSPCALADYPVTKALVTGLAQPPATIGVRRIDGDVSWAVFTAVPVLETPGGAASGVVVTFMDITARRKAEAALRQSEGQLRSILDSAPNWVVAADRAGRILFVNRPWLGVTREQVIGHSLWEFVTEEQRDDVRALIERVGRTGKTESFDMTGVSGRRYSACMGPVLHGNEVVGVTSLVEDVTSKKDLEARLAVSDRMASIGALAAGVAHEINNPLTYVLASLEFLQQKLAPDAVLADVEMMRRWAFDALDGAERIRAIVRDLSTFSHVREPSTDDVDVRPILESAIRMADTQLKFRARLVRDYHDVPPVRASDARLSQVFLNLLVNAAHAIPEGQIEQHEIRVSTRVEANDLVVIEVSDSGIGVAPEMLDKMFEPFVTSKPVGVGTGLGLYICRNIVVGLGGEITAMRNPVRGTTVRVAIPASKSPMRQRAHVAAAPASRTRQRRLRILVVDDEPQIVFALRAFLGEHQVTVAHSGRQAIEIWTSHDFDVVLCDLVMPDLTGMDVYDRIAEIRPGHQHRIAFMTGGVFTERARAFIDGLTNPVLHKPFNSAAILAIVAQFDASRPSTTPG